jgi:CRP-like cAMP-binding protein
MDGSRASLRASLEGLDWPEAAATELLGSAHVIGYEKGAVIFHAGEPADLLYVVLSGEAKLYYTGANGERLLVSIVRRGEIVGLADLAGGGGEVGGEATQVFSAHALSRCKVAIIAKARVAAVVAKLPAPQVARVMRRVNDQWARFCSRFLAFLTMDVRSRLVYAIADIGDAFGIPDARGRLITLKLTHEDFGELVGASRPMVSKHLKELAKAGVFFKQNGHYVLSRKPDVLPAPAAGSPSPVRLLSERAARRLPVRAHRGECAERVRPLARRVGS